MPIIDDLFPCRLARRATSGESGNTVLICTISASFQTSVTVTFAARSIFS